MVLRLSLVLLLSGSRCTVMVLEWLQLDFNLVLANDGFDFVIVSLVLGSSFGLLFSKLFVVLNLLLDPVLFLVYHGLLLDDVRAKKVE